MLAHLQGLPQIGLFSLREIPNLKPPISTCYANFNPPWLEKFYVVYTFLMQFFIPLCIIIVCYVSISICSLRSLRQGGFDKESTKSDSKPVCKSIELINAKKFLDKTQLDITLQTCETTNKLLSEVPSNKITKSKRNYNKSCSFGANVEINSYSNDVTQAFMRRHRSRSSNHGHKFKTIKLTLTVIIMYIFCSTPYFAGVIMSVMIPGENLNSQFLSRQFY